MAASPKKKGRADLEAKLAESQRRLERALGKIAALKLENERLQRASPASPSALAAVPGKPGLRRSGSAASVGPGSSPEQRRAAADAAAKDSEIASLRTQLRRARKEASTWDLVGRLIFAGERGVRSGLWPCWRRWRQLNG